MTRKHKKNKFHLTGFTLAEILIVVTLFAILTGIIMSTSIKGTFQKARDSKRKQDLNKLARIMEDFYNDHQQYPGNNPENPEDGTISGYKWGTSFPSYSPSLPEDPLGISNKYHYDSDPVNGSFYVLFAKLENTDDQDIKSTGCENGCGPEQKYNYVVHSSNIVLIAGLPSSSAPGGGGAGTGGGGAPPGGGGAGSASPTAGPSPTLGPPPTQPPLPTPTNEPYTCGQDQICTGWCGANTDPPGAYCVIERCCYDIYYVGGGRWKCNFILNPCI